MKIIPPKVLYEPEILYEDKHILVVNKPAGLVVQGARKEKSLLEILKSFIKERDKKTGNVFLGVVHKLDKVVSGVMVIAKRSKSARRLTESFKRKEITKLYLARVEGILKGEGIWEDYLIWDYKKRKTKVFKNFSEKAKKAITIYFSLYHSEKTTFVVLLPFTGRKHQLRAVLSEKGYPVVGDMKYGAKQKIFDGKVILLHSLYLKFPHPLSKEQLEFWVNAPEYFSFDEKYKDKIFFLLKRFRNNDIVLK